MRFINQKEKEKNTAKAAKKLPRKRRHQLEEACKTSVIVEFELAATQ